MVKDATNLFGSLLDICLKVLGSDLEGFLSPLLTAHSFAQRSAVRRGMGGFSSTHCPNPRPALPWALTFCRRKYSRGAIDLFVVWASSTSLLFSCVMVSCSSLDIRHPFHRVIVSPQGYGCLVTGVIR